MESGVLHVYSMYVSNLQEESTVDGVSDLDETYHETFIPYLLLSLV